jgi:hypothetical protein
MTVALVSTSTTGDKAFNSAYALWKKAESQIAELSALPDEACNEDAFDDGVFEADRKRDRAVDLVISARCVALDQLIKKVEVLEGIMLPGSDTLMPEVAARCRALLTSIKADLLMFQVD